MEEITAYLFKGRILCAAHMIETVIAKERRLSPAARSMDPEHVLSMLFDCEALTIDEMEDPMIMPKPLFGATPVRCCEC